MKRTLGVLSVLIAATAAPAFAHHPFDSEFDATAPITLKGTVAKVDWSDPHVRIMLDVKENSGQEDHWSLEAASPAEMAKMGWTTTTLKNGEEITVQGYKAKAEPAAVSARTITMPDGKKMSSASDDGGPKS